MNAFLMYKFTETADKVGIALLSITSILYSKLQLTLPRDSSSEVVAKIERVFDGDAGGIPHLLELGERGALPDAHHEILGRNQCHSKSVTIVKN